jgi:chromosome partitioning protein
VIAERTTITREAPIADRNLADGAAARRSGRAIIDMDAEQGTTTKWGQRRNGKEQDKPTVLSGDAVTLAAKLEALKSQGVEWVFLDLPGRAHPIAGAGMKEAELVIIPCRPLDVDIEASLDTVYRCNRGKKPYAYLINIAPSQQGKKRAKQIASFLRAHGHTVAEPIIVQRIEVPDAIADGLGVNEAKPKSSSTEEFASLFKSQRPNLPRAHDGPGEATCPLQGFE